MLGILCLLSCLGAVFCGGIGLTEPLVQYPLGARTSVAYGNNAFLARYAGLGTPVAGAAIASPFAAHVATPFAAVQEGIVAGPVATHAFGGSVFAARTALATPVASVAAAPVAAVTAAPVAAVTPAPYVSVTPAPYTAEVAHTAVAAPVAAVSAPLVASAPVVSTVQHVPGVAQVPVTKYEAQPAVIQNVLDVANPKVATRKFEIRRPAIQKQFYDIEERVVVRPAGSAVVELDQPISKNQRGPTVVRPAGQPILSALPAFPIHSYPVQGPTVQQPVIPSVGVNPIPPQPSAPQPGLGDQPEFDDSESVSVDNPEFSSARIGGSQQQRLDVGELRTLQLQRVLEQSRSQAEARAQQEYQAQARAQQELLAEARAQLEQQAQARAQQEARARQQLEAEAKAQQEFQARARIQAQQQLIEQQQAIEQQQQAVEQQLQARFRSQQASQRVTITPTPAPVRESAEIRSRTGGLRLGDVTSGLARSSVGVEEIPSVRNLPEVELSNQARLIALLTERGAVSELRSADSSDGRVRARVLSATPAPLNAAVQDEKVSTRRVVVNRPIQTVQEVDVVEPFTKIERVAVNQPALIKTARLGVANVATSVPVQTYTHAHPVATAIPFHTYTHAHYAI